MTPNNDPGAWVSVSKTANRPLFSELDVLLRALDRFFLAENFSPSGEDPATEDFSEELRTVKGSILRILGILEVVIPESRKNAYWFQKYAETKLLPAGKRDKVREGLSRQDTPEQSLYRLYDSFINLKGVISDLAKGSDVSYLGFMNIGRMISREIRENTFFNPFRRPLNPEFDEIRNREISDIVKALKPREFKKSVSLMYIYLFRFLRFLDFIDIGTQRMVPLNASLIILVLLRSEIVVYRGHIEKTTGKIEDPSLSALLQSIGYQFSMETKRVYLQELKDIYRKKGSPRFRGAIENSYGILKNLTEHNIVQLTQYFKPETRGENIFASFVARRERSLRLREDIVVLHTLLCALRNAGEKRESRVSAFETLRKYMVYFESFTFSLLRHDDYEEFVSFFNGMNTLKGDVVDLPQFSKLKEKIAQFTVFLETTLRSIENRSELSNTSIDTERVEALVRQYS